MVRIAEENDKKEEKDRFPLVTCAALDAEDYTPRPIITGCLYANHPAVPGGMFKTGKTLISMDGGISIASGRLFLNAFTVPASMTVVYFSGEGGPSMIQEYGRRIAASKGLQLADVPNLHFCFSVPRLEDLRDLDAIQRIHDDTAAEVMFFDNLMLAMSGDEAGNVFRMGQILGNVVRICNQRNITPVFVHHFKRTRVTADPYAPGELLDLTQAGAAEVAGQWWLLTRREAYDPDDPGEHRLWLNIGGRLGHGCLHALDIHEGRLSDPGGRRWDVEVLHPEDARQAVDDRRDQERTTKARAAVERDADKVLRALAKLPDGATKNTIRDRAGLSGARVNAAIAWLLEQGAIVETTIQVSNHRNPQPGYKLAPSEGQL